MGGGLLKKTIILGLLCSLLGILVSVSHFGMDLEENLGLSMLFKLRGDRQPPQEALVVALDRESSDHLGLHRDFQNWPRSLHAELISKLAAEGVDLIVFDINFTDPSEDDPLFAKAIGDAGNVVLLEFIESEKVPLKDSSGNITGEIFIDKMVQPNSVLAKEAMAVASFPLPKVPLTVRQYWTFMGGSEDFPTLPVVAFQIFSLQVHETLIELLKVVLAKPDIAWADLDEENKASFAAAQRIVEWKSEGIVSGGKILELIRDMEDVFGKPTLVSNMALEELENPDSPFSVSQEKKMLISLIRMYQDGNSRYLNFYGPPRTISTVPFHEVLNLPETVKVNNLPVDFEGKAVFVGSSDIFPRNQQDGIPTVFSQRDGLDLSGVEICATAFANLLEDFPVRPLDFPLLMFVLVVSGMVLAFIGLSLSPALAFICSAALIITYIGMAYYQFVRSALWFPVMVPAMIQMPFALFGGILWKYVETSKERTRIRKAFGFYVPDGVVDQLAKSIGNFKDGGKMVNGTCLATDVANFTSLVETMHPEEVRRLMNQYYEIIFGPVRNHGGIVLEVKGDSMLAIWAGPQPDPQLKTKACLAAIEINKALDQFNRSDDHPKIQTRIGLHSGSILLGNIGGGTHYEYTATGDPLNTVTRIEGLNKALGTHLLASEEVVKEIDGIRTRQLGTFLMSGKTNTVTVHEVMATETDCPSSQNGLCKNFSEALDLFRKRQWSEAKRKFEQILNHNHTDGPSQFYLKLCRDFEKKPPWEGWDNVIRMEWK